MGDTYFPDTKEPHLHHHKGGIDYTSTKHAHKKLKEGDKYREDNCKAVIDELKVGNDREKKIAEEIKRLLRVDKGRPPAKK